MHFVVGWKVPEADEAAIAKLPTGAWIPAAGQDDEPQDDADVAEITGLDERLNL